MGGVRGMIVDGQCVNAVACRKRAAKLPPKDKRPKVPK